MKLLLALLLSALLALMCAPYASGSSKSTPWRDESRSVGISYPNPNYNVVTALIGLATLTPSL